jgi:hypothetical protein
LYAASALAANVFVRCMFAGAFPLFGEQSESSTFRSSGIIGQKFNSFAVYKKLGYQWASSLLAFLSLAMMPFP